MFVVNFVGGIKKVPAGEETEKKFGGRFVLFKFIFRVSLCGRSVPNKIKSRRTWIYDFFHWQ